MGKKILILIGLFFVMTLTAQNRSVYIVFTGVEFGNTDIGIKKTIRTGYDSDKYNWPPYSFFIFREKSYDFMYWHENVKNRTDRQQTINLYPKSFLNQQPHVIDWDVVGPTLTTKAAAKQKIAEIDGYDKIYFIDRNDVSPDDMIKIVEAKRLILPVH